jgi:UDP-glucose 4-epimerase
MIRNRFDTARKPSRVVVLGASGFVGRDLARYLVSSGIDTLALSSRDLDLCNPASTDALRGLVRADDVLVIVSALTPDRGRDIATMMRNLAMVQHVSAVLEDTRLSHVVYVGSDAIYADEANPVLETSCCDPSTFHGVMHLGRERMLSYAAQKSGTPLLVLRPCALYGAGDTHNSYGPNRFLRTARADRKITLFGNGEEKRDHVHIADLSRLIGLCIEHGSEGVLNVATGTSVSFMDIAREVASLVGEDVTIECLPRSSPITHRHFDTVATITAFPHFRYTTLGAGLRASLDDSSEG